MADTKGGPGQQDVLAAMRRQIDWCRTLGSPFTAAVLTVLADDLAVGGALTAFLADWRGDPLADALPLRLAGALHALVLAGTCPALAACYPPAAQPGLDDAIRRAMVERHGFVRGFIESPPQTNEVGRSGVLLGGFLHIAAATGLPLRLLEIGASAGLNLAWDRYRYRLGSVAWGDPASPLLLAPAWEGPPPPTPAICVLDRRGCDVAPIDIHDPAQRLRLRAYVWADQQDRLARLDQALAVAATASHGVDQADAVAWSAANLHGGPDGCTTVIYHSIMWQYMPQRARDAIGQSIRQAGEAATAGTPLAWLRFEPERPDARPELSLTLWPGEHHRVLARAHPHGTAVTWLAPAA